MAASSIEEKKLLSGDAVPNIGIVSAYNDMANIRIAMNRGAFDFVTKPFRNDDIFPLLARIERERRAEAKAAAKAAAVAADGEEAVAHALTYAKAAAKAAAGHLERVPVARVNVAADALRTLRDEGYWAIGAAMEGSPSPEVDPTKSEAARTSGGHSGWARTAISGCCRR